MAQTITTISGNLTHEPDFGITPKASAPLCKLRVASSRRARVKRTRELGIDEAEPKGTEVHTDDYGKRWVEEDTWADVDTLYLDVECWNDLAVNVGASLFRGAPVTISGYLVTDQWEDKYQKDDDGHPVVRSKIKMRATDVSFDLSRFQIATRKTTNVTHVPEGMEAPKMMTAEDLLAQKSGQGREASSASDYLAQAERESVSV